MDDIVYQCPECNFNADNLTELDNHMDDFHANINGQANVEYTSNDQDIDNEYAQQSEYENDNHDYNENNEDFYAENDDNIHNTQTFDSESNHSNQNLYDNAYNGNISNHQVLNKPHNLRQKQVLNYNHLNSTSSADVPNSMLLPQAATTPNSTSQVASSSKNNNSQAKRTNAAQYNGQSRASNMTKAAPMANQQTVINSDNHYERQYTCKRCGFFTNNPRAVLYHRRDFHFEKINVHECIYCQYASQYSGKVERHTLLRHKIDTNNTPKKQIVNRVKADDSFNNSLNLTALHNNELDSSLSNRSMNLTNRSVSKPNNIDALNQSQSSNPNSPMMITKYQCNKCPCKYKRSNDLSKHLKMKHGIVAQRLSEYLVRIPVESIWSKMDENNDLNDYSVNNDTSIGHNESKVLNKSDVRDDSQMNRPKLSSIAPKTGQQASKEQSQNLKKGTYECPYCTYYSNGNDAEYLLHVKDHLSGKSFRCVLCNSVYKYRGDCVVHLKRKHQKADMYAQNYVERFNLETVDISQVCELLKPKQTEENENEEKLFRCAYCDYKANYKGDVFKHQTRRHPGSVKNVTALAQTQNQGHLNGIAHSSDGKINSKGLNHGATLQHNNSLNTRYTPNKTSVTRMNTNNQNYSSNKQNNQHSQYMNNNNNNSMNDYVLEGMYNNNEYENGDNFYYNNVKESSNYSNHENQYNGNDTENDIYDDSEYNQPDEASLYEDINEYDTDVNYNSEPNYGNSQDLDEYNNIENEYIDPYDDNVQNLNDPDNKNMYNAFNKPNKVHQVSTILASVLNGTKESNQHRPGSSLSSMSSSSFNSNNKQTNQRSILPATNGHLNQAPVDPNLSSSYLANLKFLARRRSQHALRERKFKCPMCPRTSKWQWDIRKHMRTVHRGQEGGDVIILKDKDLIKQLSNNPKVVQTDIDIDQIKSKCAILNNRSQVFANKNGISKGDEICDSDEMLQYNSQAIAQHNLYKGAQMGNNSLSAGTDPTGNKKFKCTACPYRSNWKADLFRHLRKRHYIQRPALNHIVILDAEFAATSLPDYERIHGVHIRKRSRTELDSNAGNEAKREKLYDEMQSSFSLVDDIDQQNQLQHEENNIELLNRNNRLPVSIAELNIKPYKCLKCGFRSDRKSDTLRHIRVKHSMGTQAVKYLRILSIKEASESIEQYENMRLYKKIKNFNTVHNSNCDVTENSENVNGYSDQTYSENSEIKKVDGSQCDEHFFDDNTLSETQGQSESKSMQDYYRCPFCSFKDSNKHVMRRHLVIHFSGAQSVRVTNPVYRCSLCTFRSKWQFFVKKHITTHHLSVRNAYVLRYPAKPGKKKNKKNKKDLNLENGHDRVEEDCLETEISVDLEDGAKDELVIMENSHSNNHIKTENNEPELIETDDNSQGNANRFFTAKYSHTRHEPIQISSSI